MITIICHFYNEEYLLSFWLKHHKQFFDHGIMVDYDSTDNSCDIIKEICPSWEIRKSRNKYFERPLVDPEIMDIEREIKDGWKICLNVTEFVFYPNIKLYLSQLDPGVSGVWLKPIVLIDKQENRDKELDCGKSIISQCTTGVVGACPPRWTQYGRLLHKLETGEYIGEGRHNSMLRNVIKPDNVFHLWYGYAPWNKKFRDRKLQIKNRISPEYKAGAGIDTMGPHLWLEETLEKKFLEYQPFAGELRSDPIVNDYFNKLS